LGQVKKDFADITPLLNEEFDFIDVDENWQIRPNTKLGSFVPMDERIKFYVKDYLKSVAREGKKATFDEIIYNVMPMLINGEQPTHESILQVLEKIAHYPDGQHWILVDEST
jgi:hypothetical protein